MSAGEGSEVPPGERQDRLETGGLDGRGERRAAAAAGLLAPVPVRGGSAGTVATAIAGAGAPVACDMPWTATIIGTSMLCRALVLID